MSTAEAMVDTQGPTDADQLLVATSAAVDAASHVLQLAKDGVVMGELPLSSLLLLNDSRYPWFVLVPRREEISEIYQLEEAEQQQLWRESSQLGRFLMASFNGDKLNIGALGNLVPQLHLHHIVRYRSDATWPGPVWGVGTAKPYSDGELEAMRLRCRSLPDLC